MAEKMTRGQIQDLVGKFAAENPKYRSALLSNPKGTIEKQLNTSLGNVKVKAVVETADMVYVVVPHIASEGELSDADLEKHGRHPELGIVTLRQLLATWVAHDLDHVVQISRVLARQYSDEVGPWRAYLRIISGQQG